MRVQSDGVNFLFSDGESVQAIIVREVLNQGFIVIYQILNGFGFQRFDRSNGGKLWILI